MLDEDLGEGEHLIEVPVRARYVGEARAHAERALFERVAEIVDHPLELRRFGRSCLDAHRRHAEGAMSGERCDVQRNAGVF